MIGLSSRSNYTNEILDDIECYKAVLDGRLKRFPRGFWTKPWSLQSASVLTRYLLEDRLKYTEKDIKEKFNVSLLKDSRLTSLLKLFGDSPYGVIDNAYPGVFKPWEFRVVPNGFWEDKKNIVDAIRWLVETKLGNNREKVCKEFNNELLIKHNLATLKVHGMYNLLEMVYPGEFKPWELSVVPTGFWDNKKNIIQAVRWLVETKLDNNRERVCKEFTRELLNKHCLASIGKYGVYNLLDMAYPNEFKPWELKCSPNGFWDDKTNIKDAVRWLVETKLGNSKERVRKEFTADFLISNGVSILIHHGLFNVLNMTYPNEFNPSDFQAGKSKLQ